MKIIYNKIIPPSGFKALTMWPLLFVRSMYMSKAEWQHEEIHGEQQREMLSFGLVGMLFMLLVGCGWWSLLALPLYLYVYGLMWLWKVLEGSKDPYKNNPLEQEAYFFQGDEGYMERRKPFAWFQFLKY